MFGLNLYNCYMPMSFMPFNSWLNYGMFQNNFFLGSNNFAMPMFNFSSASSVPNFTGFWGNGAVSNNNSDKGLNTKSVSQSKCLQLIKEHVKKVEGDYAIVAGDSGGATKWGVTHTTYDYYRSKIKQLPKRSVKEMTNDEYSEIIEWFWKQSGADKIDNPILAFYVFSTDWGSGIGKSKKFLQQCDGDPEKFEEARRAFYNKIAVGEKAKFKKGWQNRVTRDHNFAYSNFSSGSKVYVA